MIDNIRRKELELCSSDELDLIIRNQLDSDTPDRETVLLALSILEERDPTNSTNRPEGAQEAWHRAVMRPAHLGKNCKTKRKHMQWLTAVAAAIVVFVLLAVVPQSVGAESIFEIIGRWTRDTFGFSFGIEDQNQDGYIFKSDHEGLQQIYAAVVAQGVTEPVVPTWIPEGYELIELKTVHHINSKKIIACLCKESNYILLSYEIYRKDLSNFYPKDTMDVVEYEYAGVTVYMASNNKTEKAMWTTDDVECLIEVNDAEEVLERIFRSIYD